jgi:hypothetical protein
MKGQLPKAYLRMDPNLDVTHPDPGAFVKLLCAAARQPKRGRFKTWAVLVAAVGRAQAVKHRDVWKDLVAGEKPDSLMVDGWDLWQEGDLTVGERVKRFRERHSAVTEPLPVTPETPLPPSEASGVRRQGVRNEHEGSGSSSVPPPHAATTNPLVDRPALEAEGRQLLRQIAEREDLDPTEVLSTASGWKGKGGFVRLDTLYDDRLARTLIALRSWWRRLNGEPEPGPPAALAVRDQAPPLSPLTEHNLRALGLKGGE